MVLAVFITIFSLIALASFHEFGHFILAKRFGVKIEEFGIGYPPRIFGKKIGETVYSLNLLPFGAFVRIYGEEDQFTNSSSQDTKEVFRIEKARSFREKAIWQRAAIILGGVISFWIIGAILLTLVLGIGAPVAISDEQEAPEARVLIVAVAEDSPAQQAGIEVGDTIVSLQGEESEVEEVNKIREVQEFIENHKGKELTLTLKKGKEVQRITLVPREKPPENEGAMGVALARVAIQSYPFYLAPIKGIQACLGLTSEIILGLFRIFKSLVQGKGLPAGVGIVGPVGIGSLIFQSFQLGLVYYLQFVATIAIYLAVFNTLPIPAVDGGKLLFLGAEKIKGSPVNQNLERKINTFFFSLLLFLMILVTIRDIRSIF